jgi:PAS domain S-box-containing protein
MSWHANSEMAPKETELDVLLLRSITDYSIITLDLKGHVISWNPGARRLLGYMKEEIIGQHVSIFYEKADRDAGLPERGLEIAAKSGSFETEGWRCRSDKSRFWAHTIIDPVFDTNNSLLGYAKITRDVTERRRLESIIRRSDDQFRALVQNVTDYAIFMVDHDGSILSWNLGAQRIKGYLAHEIIGKNISCFYTEPIGPPALP